VFELHVQTGFAVVVIQRSNQTLLVSNSSNLMASFNCARLIRHSFKLSVKVDDFVPIHLKKMLIHPQTPNLVSNMSNLHLKWYM
jgi:hypothetical protein